MAQIAPHEPRIGAPAAVIEANTASPVHRGAPAADEEQLEKLSINTIRTLAMDAVQKANSGHPGTPMALAPAAFVLWDRHLRHNPANPQWPNRDRFILSNGHASMLLYSLLYLTGYGLTLEELKNFDVIFFDDFSHRAYFNPSYLERVRDFVRDGGGLAMLGGPRSFDAGGYGESALKEALPVELDGKGSFQTPAVLNVTAAPATGKPFWVTRLPRM